MYMYCIERGRYVYKLLYARMHMLHLFHLFCVRTKGESISSILLLSFYNFFSFTSVQLRKDGILLPLCYLLKSCLFHYLSVNFYSVHRSMFMLRHAFSSTLLGLMYNSKVYAHNRGRLYALLMLPYSSTCGRVRTCKEQLTKIANGLFKFI